MVQHTAAINVIKRPQIRRAEQIAGDKANILKPANLTALLGNGAGGFGHIQIGNLVRMSQRGQDLRQLHQRIPGSSPRNQGAQGLFPVPFAAPEVVIHLHRP